MTLGPTLGANRPRPGPPRGVALTVVEPADRVGVQLGDGTFRLPVRCVGMAGPGVLDEVAERVLGAGDAPLEHLAAGVGEHGRVGRGSAPALAWSSVLAAQTGAVVELPNVVPTTDPVLDAGEQALADRATRGRGISQPTPNGPLPKPLE